MLNVNEDCLEALYISEDEQAAEEWWSTQWEDIDLPAN